MSKQKIAIDFDGVLHSYTSTWKGKDIIPDPPVVGAKEALTKLAESYHIIIFSVRATTQSGADAVKAYLERHQIPFNEVTAVKPPACCYIDDRAVTFKGDWQETLAQINVFKTWQNKE